MRKVLVTVSQASDGTFWCHTEKDVYGVGLNAAGQTVKEAKDDLLACLEEARADYEESGKTAELVEFRYQYDLQSFFNYFSFLNVTEVAKRAGCPQEAFSSQSTPWRRSLKITARTAVSWISGATWRSSFAGCCPEKTPLREMW